MSHLNNRNSTTGKGLDVQSTLWCKVALFGSHIRGAEEAAGGGAPARDL